MNKKGVFSLCLVLALIAGLIVFASAFAKPSVAVPETGEAERAWTDLSQREAAAVKQMGRENLPEAEQARLEEELRTLRFDCAAYFDQYGFDRYEGIVYNSTEVLKQNAKDFIALAEGMKKREEAGIPTPETAVAQAGLVALYDAKAQVMRDYLAKLERIDESKADLKALSAEYELCFWLPDNADYVKACVAKAEASAQAKLG